MFLTFENDTFLCCKSKGKKQISEDLIEFCEKREKLFSRMSSKARFQLLKWLFII